MPANTRSSGAPDTGICAVSPSQQAGSLGNLTSRVEAIEAVLAALLGGDVTANQLSDLATNGGVITDLVAVASNAAGGWTTDGTFTGTAISTLGWTLSDGNAYPVVTMVDGVLQYGFNLNGTVQDNSGTSGAGAYAYVTRPSNSSDWIQGASGVSIILNNVGSSNVQGDMEFRVHTGGIYLAGAGVSPTWSSAGANHYAVYLNKTGSETWFRSGMASSSDIAAGSTTFVSVTGVFQMETSGVIGAHFSKDVGSTSGADGTHAWVCKIG